MKLQDRGRSLKSGKPIKQADSDQHAATPGTVDVGNSVPPMTLGNLHKPRPSRKVTGVEEVVKNMSNIPCYLQRMEKGDDVQEKALNFGVLDWGRLEKWTYIQKQVANRIGGDSPSSSNTSSSFSTFGSSSQSGRSIDSPLALRKQSPALKRNSSAEDHRTKMMEEQNSGRIMGYPDSRTTPNNTLIGHNHEKGMIKDSDTKGISHNKSQPPLIDSLTLTSKGRATSAFAQNKMKTQIGSTREAEKFRSCEQQSCPGDLQLAGNWLQDQCSTVEGMWDHLQESVHGRRISFESTIFNNGRPVEVNCNSFSGKFPSGNAQFTNLSPHIPLPCPLTSTSLSNEPAVASTPLSGNEVPTTNLKGKHTKNDLFNTSEQFVVNMAGRSGEDEVKATAEPRRELSPHHRSSAGLNRIRSSSLMEGSSAQQMKRTVCSDKSHEGNAAANSRGRRSPLRRILDPVLKSKNHFHFSGPIASSSSHQAQELSNTDKLPIQYKLKLAKGVCNSSDTSINPSTGQVTYNEGSVQNERHVTSTSQALLKLAWKNGLPLYMFSSNDNNILAATIGKRSISSKKDFECIYTVFTSHEVKKKSGVWISRGNKSKKHGLVYNVVGEIGVSSSKLTSYDSKSHSVVGEFVLFGDELKPTPPECVSSLFNSELAAIVVKVQNGRPEGSNRDVLHSCSCRDSSQTNLAEDKCSCSQVESLPIEHNTENSSLSSIVAILPTGVHGLSSTGDPSPLIERWKSGGSCDCGGWDKGCMLTVLTNKSQDSKSSGSAQPCSTTDGTHRLELFAQGGARESRHAFSIVSFQEGLYTVDFEASIALLQAFAICIAAIHSRRPTDLSGLHYSEAANSL